jgi:hypothetical protein
MDSMIELTCQCPPKVCKYHHEGGVAPGRIRRFRNRKHDSEHGQRYRRVDDDAGSCKTNGLVVAFAGSSSTVAWRSHYRGPLYVFSFVLTFSRRVPSSISVFVFSQQSGPACSSRLQVRSPMALEYGPKGRPRWRT